MIKACVACERGECDRCMNSATCGCCGVTSVGDQYGYWTELGAEDDVYWLSMDCE